MKTVKFNLSPSLINLYNESQLRFYYTIMKYSADTETVQCYGTSGSIIHDVLEKYAKDKTLNYVEMFDKFWEIRHLDKLLDVKGQTLNKSDYLKALLNGVRLINNKYTDIIAEETLKFPLISNNDWEIGIKGIIDVQCKLNNEYVIVDYKTSNSVDSGENFKRQGLHYCWSVWKSKNILPKKVIFEYLKLNQSVEYSFDEIDMKRYEEYLINLANEIMKKGTDINNYEIGDIDSIFNQYKNTCLKEKLKRNIEQDKKVKKVKFILKIKQGKIFILNKLSPLLQKMLVKQFSYEDSNSSFIRQSGSNWDGIYRLYNQKKQYLDRGFLDRLLKILESYADYKEMEFDYEIIEDCNNNPKGERSDFKDKLIGIDLREEQEESVAIMLEKQWGRIKLPTGVGKTVTAAEFIRQHKLRTLFIVDTLDLLLQAREELKNTLGEEIGIIGGGAYKEYFITVATYQSLLKKCDDKFFARQQCVIIDECQIGAAKSIKEILKKCYSTYYRLGLSATPIHKEHDLQIEGLLGSIVYSLETTKAQDKGYLVNAKIKFYHCPINSEEYDWRSDYEYNIINNNVRNQMIVDYVEEKAKLGETSIILTKSVEHGMMLNDMIKNSFHIHGSINKNIRFEKWNELRKNNINIIIATLKIACKGLNIKNLNHIVNASANGNGDDSIQALGRVLRLFNDKNVGTYIDFLDKGKYSKHWARIRYKSLEKEGHDIEVI